MTQIDPFTILNNTLDFFDNLKKSFINKNFIYIYLLFIPHIIFVYLYNGQSTSITNIDLNNRIIENICIWNLLHSVVFFILCIILHPESIYDYINIIIVMILWFLFEYFIYKINKKLNLIKVNKNVIKGGSHLVYDNPYIPRYDDFIFNISGVLLYVIKNTICINLTPTMPPITTYFNYISIIFFMFICHYISVIIMFYTYT